MSDVFAVLFPPEFVNALLGVLALVILDLSSYQGTKAELVPLLQQVQEALGYLPEEAMFRIAKFTGTPESEVYSVATFYAQFRLTPMGRKRS